MSRIRLKVKDVARAKGISMTLLSHKSYVALSTIRGVFRDPYKTVNTDTLKRLADALETSIFDLMEEVPDDVAQEEETSDNDTEPS